MIRLTGYQPQYFPRLHYFARILNADIFTITDYVQFVRAHRFPAGGGKYARGRSYQADTSIKSSQGIAYLTVPVAHRGLQPINETRVSYENRWQEKHVKSIRVNYASAAQFEEVFPHISGIILRSYANLAALNTATILWTLGWLMDGRDFDLMDSNVDTINARLVQQNRFRLKKIVLKSQTEIADLPMDTDATDSIIATCQLLKAAEYYCGGTALTEYLEASRFEQAGIRLVEQDWQCGIYTQQFSRHGFIPNLSIIDLIMNENRDTALKILGGISRAALWTGPSTSHVSSEKGLR